MKPFDYSASSFEARKELREDLRRMTDEERAAALKNDPDYRAAALETKPRLSGLAPSQHALMVEEELKRRYPLETQDTGDRLTAVRLNRELQQVVKTALENELTSAGASISEPPKPPEPKPATWE